LAGVIGLSIALMGPSLTVAFNVTLVAAAVGNAAPLVFLLGMLNMIPIAIAFASFSRSYPSAGSAIAFIEVVLGPRAGALAGWLLLLTYISFAVATCSLAGSFFDAAVASQQLALPRMWAMVSVASLLVSLWLAYRNVEVATRLMLVLEGIALLAIIVLGVIILVADQPSSHQILSSFTPPSTPRAASAIGYAVVFAFLSFGGFEASATLGEETAAPRRDIPIAMVGTIIVIGIFFIFATATEVIGYASIAPGRLASADAPLDFLAQHFVSARFATVLDLCNAISAFACMLGSMTAAARLVFSLGRTSLLPGLGAVHLRYGTPSVAVVAVGIASLAVFLLFAPMVGPTRFYGEACTIGALALMLIYLAVCAAFGMVKLRTGQIGLMIVGFAGAASLCWPLYNVLYPVPAYPDFLWPYVVLLWIGIGVILILVRGKGVSAPAPVKG
jgi:amino acid transporter